MNWNSVRAMDAYTRHNWYINNYVLHYGNKKDALGQPNAGRTDADVLRENHRFIRDEEEDSQNKSNWEVQFSLKYYKKLFREYCIADMSRHREGKVAMRWRIDKEVISGKGHFVCGAKGCEEHKGLRSYEVNFAYREDGERKNALVKLRVCPRCGFRMHYKKYKALPRKEYKAIKRRMEEAMQNGGYEEDLAAQQHARDQAYAERDRQGSREEYLRKIRKNSATARLDEPPPPKRARGTMEGLDVTTKEEEEAATKEATQGENSVWMEKPKVEKRKDDEFDDYFAGMFP